MEPQFIRYEVVDPVATITLCRPEVLNAFHGPMLAELQRAVEAAVADPAVVGIVITGDGRGFCAGLDAAALAATTERGSSERAPVQPDELPGLFSYLLEQPKPIIAAVNGVAAGGGFILALKCDLRIASTDAAFTSIFTKRGLIAEHGATWFLPRMVGMGAALDLLWSSRKIGAEEAYRLGLVQQVVAPDELLATASAYIVDLATNVTPYGIAETKRLVYSHHGSDLRRALEEADDATWAAVSRADAREGVRALIERRPPQFERLGRQGAGGEP